MKKIAVVLLLMSLYLVCPAPGQASYLIQLKNGTEFVTSYYWQEGNQVMFYTYGGVFGIAKEFIRKIEQSDRPSKSEAVERVPAESVEPKSEKAVAKKEKEIASTPKQPQKKDEETVKEFRLLQKRFGQLNDLPTAEIYSLSDELKGFKRKISNSNLANDHKEEIAAADAMLSAIEGYLKAGSR